ncbi:TPA: hypothetical protein ACQSOI_003800 [Enterobacter hormaechei]|nr:hypothetical protein [Cronobacter sakazakii]
MNKIINDVKHINPLIEEAHPEVKAYIENIEDNLEYYQSLLLQVLEGNDIGDAKELMELLTEDLQYYKERNARTRNKG